MTSSLPWNLELNAAGITKGSGLRNLCQYLGIEAEETMAFGDGENDWPMSGGSRNRCGDGKWRPIFKGTRRPDCRFEPGRGRSGGDQTMGCLYKRKLAVRGGGQSIWFPWYCTGITADSSAWQSQPFTLVLSLGVFILVRRLSRICFAAMRWSIRRWRTA